MRRPPISDRIDELRTTLVTRPDPTWAARRLMSLVADPTFRREADPIEHPQLARRLWSLLGRIGELPLRHALDAPVAMERHGPTGTILGFVPAGLHQAPFVFFESERAGLLVAPGARARGHHRFTLPAAVEPIELAVRRRAG